MLDPKLLATPASDRSRTTVDSVNPGVDLAEASAHLSEAIAKRVQPEQYETWFRRSALVRIDDDAVVLAVQNGFARDWLENYYLRIVENAVQAVLDRRLPVRIVVDPELAVGDAPATESPAGPAVSPLVPQPPAAARPMSSERRWKSSPPDLVASGKCLSVPLHTQTRSTSFRAIGGSNTQSM